MPFIVAGVLKKFISNKPGQTAPAEDAGSGEIPPTPPAAKPFTVTPQTPVMEDIPPDKNNLSKDVAIKGTVKFVKEFVFDGNLEGEISSDDGILTIGEKADVRGEVKSKTVIVKGKVHGNITVKERCELHSRSQLIGDLKAARLVIEEGATFLGKSEVAPDKNIIKDLGAPPPQKEELKKVGAPSLMLLASDALSKFDGSTAPPTSPAQQPSPPAQQPSVEAHPPPAPPSAAQARETAPPVVPSQPAAATVTPVAEPRAKETPPEDSSTQGEEEETEGPQAVATATTNLNSAKARQTG